MKIAVCDDDKLDIVRLKKLIQAYLPRPFPNYCSTRCVRKIHVLQCYTTCIFV